MFYVVHFEQFIKILLSSILVLIEFTTISTSFSSKLKMQEF